MSMPQGQSMPQGMTANMPPSMLANMPPEMLASIPPGMQVPVLGPHARVNQSTFIGIYWGGTIVAAIFYAFRLLVRYKIFGRLQTDDALVFFSWVLLLTNSILWQTGKEALYETIAVSTGQLFPPPTNFAHNTEQYLRKSAAAIVFWYTGLYAVKLSFLIFFKRLGQNVRNQKVIWWTVFAITVAAYCACLGDTDYKCLASSFEYISTHCSLPKTVKFDRDTLKANLALDVVTDVLIILVPVSLLWSVRLSLRKKLALGSIFSITVFVMIFAIVRVVVVSNYSAQPDQSWLYMWSHIEHTVAIMVACIASFPSFFKNSDRDQAQWSGSKRLLRLLISPRSWSRKSFKEVSDISEGKDSHNYNFSPNIPGATMTGVRTFIDKQGKTVNMTATSGSSEDDEEMWPIKEQMAHRHV